MGSIGKAIGDDLLGIIQYPDTKLAQEQYNAIRDKSLGQIDSANKLATGGYGRAQGYGNQSGGMYQNLGNLGMSERDTALNMLNSILGEYGNTAGVSTPLSFNAAKGGAAPGARTPSSAPGRIPAANALQNAIGQSAYPAKTANPYALTDAQQVQANQQIDQINKEKESAIGELKALYAQQGITDPRAMEAGIQQLSERYDAMAAGHKANFAEAARSDREKALSGMIDLFTNLMQGGSSKYGASAQGLQSVGSQAQNLGDTQSQQAAQLLSNMTGSAQNNLLAQQQAARQYESDFMSLLGTIASGGMSNVFDFGTKKKESYQDKYKGAV